MSRFPTLAAFTAALALTAASSAATYYWNGTTGNLSDLRWLNGQPAGGDTDMLHFGVGDYTVTADAAHDPWTVNGLKFAEAGSVTLAASNSSGLRFAGNFPRIDVVSYFQHTVTISAPLIFDSPTLISGEQSAYAASLRLTGALSGPAPLGLRDNPTTIYHAATSPSFAGDLWITSTWNGILPGLRPLVWNVPAQSSPGPLRFGQGTLRLHGGAFQLESAPHESVPLTFAMPIDIGPSGGRLTTASSAPVQLTGPVALGGTLSLGAAAGLDTTAQGGSLTLTGTITLEQNFPPTLNPAAPLVLTTTFDVAGAVVLAGNIVDGPGSHVRPLVLAPSVTSLTIAGTANTYAHGTLIRPPENSHYVTFTPNGHVNKTDPYFRRVIIAPGATLGPGPVVVSTGATFVLSEAANLRPGQKVDGAGTVVVPFESPLASLLHPHFSGTIAFDRPTVTTPLDQGALGNGRVTLASFSATTYAAASLLPGIDHVYRIGGGDGLLTLATGALQDAGGGPSSLLISSGTLAAANSYSGGTTVGASDLRGVRVTADGALGSGNVRVLAAGHLTLLTPAAYSPAAFLTVETNGTLVLEGNGRVPAGASAPVFLPGSYLVLGNNNSSGPTDFYPDALPLSLNASTLNIVDPVQETVGDLSVAGFSQIAFFPGASLTAASLSLQSAALLDIANLDPESFEEPPRVIVSGLAPVNGMLPPAIALARSTPHHFAAPNAGGALVPAAYATMPTNGGTGVEVVNVTEVTELSVNTSIYALRASADISAPDPAVTLTLGSGGLFFTSAAISANVDFGDAEAVIRTTSAKIHGAVTARKGLTAFGSGNLHFTSPSNQIQGPIHLYGVSLWATSIGPIPSDDPIVFHPAGASDNCVFSTSGGSAVINRPLQFLTSISKTEGAWVGDLVLTKPVTVSGTFYSNHNVRYLGGLQLTGTSSAILNFFGNRMEITGPVAAPNASVDIWGKLLLTQLPSPTAFRAADLTLHPWVGSVPTQLDLTTNALILSPADKAATLAALRTHLATGRNDGLWTGGGITSSTVPTTPGTSLALVDNADLHLSSFRGFALDDNSIIVVQALVGDATLDGEVDAFDLNLLAAHWQQETGALWSAGDFNGDAKVDAFDLNLLAAHWQSQAAAPLLQVTASFAAVPEPSSLALLALTSAALLARRRRRACSFAE